MTGLHGPHDSTFLAAASALELGMLVSKTGHSKEQAVDLPIRQVPGRLYESIGGDGRMEAMAMNKVGTARILLLGMLISAAACVSHPFPESSLTGQVLEVTIGDVTLTPQVVTVRRGDEVRWVNTTKAFVDISFMQSLAGVVSCRKGFLSTGWGSMYGASGINYLFVARVDSNHYASLCFSIPGTFQYAVETDATVAGKTTMMHGTVTIE